MGEKAKQVSKFVSTNEKKLTENFSTITQVQIEKRLIEYCLLISHLFYKALEKKNEEIRKKEREKMYLVTILKAVVMMAPNFSFKSNLAANR